MGQPDFAAFHLFLLGHKKRVTRVTRVTASESKDVAGYAEAGGRVTRVTAPEPDSAPEEAEAVERQAIAETEGGCSAPVLRGLRQAPAERLHQGCRSPNGSSQLTTRDGFSTHSGHRAPRWGGMPMTFSPRPASLGRSMAPS